MPGGVAGRLVQPAAEEGAPPILVLNFDAQAALATLADAAAMAAVRALSLSLDVAQSPESVEPFAAWQQAIRALAEELDATAVDDQSRPLTLQHFTAIHEELGKLYRALESRDMAAGTAVARRLFQ